MIIADLPPHVNVLGVDEEQVEPSAPPEESSRPSSSSRRISKKSTRSSSSSSQKESERESRTCSLACTLYSLLVLFLALALIVGLGYWLCYEKLHLDWAVSLREHSSAAASYSSDTSSSSSSTLAVNFTDMNPFFYPPSVLQQASSSGALATGSTDSPLPAGDWLYLSLSQPLLLSGALYPANLTQVQESTPSSLSSSASPKSFAQLTPSYNLSLQALSPQIAQSFLPADCASGRYSLTMHLREGVSVTRVFHAISPADKAQKAIENPSGSTASPVSGKENVFYNVTSTERQRIIGSLTNSTLAPVGVNSSSSSPPTPAQRNASAQQQQALLQTVWSPLQSATWLTLAPPVAPSTSPANVTSNSTSVPPSIPPPIPPAVSNEAAAVSLTLTQALLSQPAQSAADTQKEMVSAYLTLDDLVAKQSALFQTWADQWTQYTQTNAETTTASQTASYSPASISASEFTANSISKRERSSHNEKSSPVKSDVEVTPLATPSPYPPFYASPCNLSLSLWSLFPLFAALSLSLTVLVRYSQARSLTRADMLALTGLCAALVMALPVFPQSPASLAINSFIQCPLDVPTIQQPLSSFPSLSLQCERETPVSVPLVYERYSLAYQADLVQYYPAIVSNFNLIFGIAGPAMKQFSGMLASYPSVSAVLTKLDIQPDRVLRTINELFRRADRTVRPIHRDNIVRASSSLGGVCRYVRDTTNTQQTNTLPVSVVIVRCECSASSAYSSARAAQLAANNGNGSVPLSVSLDIDFSPFSGYAVKRTTRSALLWPA